MIEDRKEAQKRLSVTGSLAEGGQGKYEFRTFENHGFIGSTKTRCYTIGLNIPANYTCRKSVECLPRIL